MSSSLGAITLDSLSRGSGGSLLRSFVAKRCATANDVPPLTDLSRSLPKETILPLSSASSSRPLLKQWRCNFYEETSDSSPVETSEKERGIGRVGARRSRIVCEEKETKEEAPGVPT